VSAKKGLGIEELLDKVLLQAEVMNLKATPELPALGSVIEARMDRGLGVVVTGLVQKGTLRVGDLLLCGPAWGRVRRLLNDQGKEVGHLGFLPIYCHSLWVRVRFYFLILLLFSF